jgi:kinesin family protein 4/21/27
MQLEGEAEYIKTTPFPGGFFNENDGNASVKVAVRVRPLVARELRTGSSKSIVETEPEKIRMGGKEFVFDQVFDMDSRQDDVFHMCSYNQVLGCFDGYNATILAYGQTGSGKTHSMGTGSTIGMPAD